MISLFKRFCRHSNWRELERYYDEERNVTTIRFLCNSCNHQWSDRFLGLLEKKEVKE